MFPGFGVGLSAHPLHNLLLALLKKVDGSGAARRHAL